MFFLFSSILKFDHFSLQSKHPRNTQTFKFFSYMSPQCFNIQPWTFLMISQLYQLLFNRRIRSFQILLYPVFTRKLKKNSLPLSSNGIWLIGSAGPCGVVAFAFSQTFFNFPPESFLSSLTRSWFCCFSMLAKTFSYCSPFIELEKLPWALLINYLRIVNVEKSSKVDDELGIKEFRVFGNVVEFSLKFLWPFLHHFWVFWVFFKFLGNFVEF